MQKLWFRKKWCLILISAIACLVVLLPLVAIAKQMGDGSVLPFPPVPSASVAAPTLQDSTHKRRAEANHLPANAPMYSLF